MASNQVVLEFQQLRPIDLRKIHPIPGQITDKEPVLAMARVFALGYVALDTSRDSALADVDEAFFNEPY